MSKKCSTCGSVDIIEDCLRGEKICSKCGLVIEEHKIDYSPEWTGEENNMNNLTTGLPSTEFMQGHGKGSHFEGKNEEFKKLEKYNINSKDKDSDEPTTIQSVRIQTRRIGSILNLPRYVQEGAIKMYKKLSKKGIVRGRSIDNMIVSCIYTICRNFNLLYTIDEFSEISSANRDKILENHKRIKKELDINNGHVTAVDYTDKFCSDLGLDNNQTNKVKNIIKEVRNDFVGKNPRGIVGGVIYAVMLEEEEDYRDRLSQELIAEVTGVSNVTIRSRFNEVIEKIDFDEENLSRSDSKH